MLRVLSPPLCFLRCKTKPPFLLAIAIVSLFIGAVVPAADFPGETGEWQGFASHQFDLDGRACLVIAPGERATGAPWLWRADRPDPESALDSMLLEKGFHIAFIDVEDLYGNHEAVKRWNAFYALLQEKMSLSDTPALAAVGPGALLTYNWAAENPAQVACIYGELPWLALPPPDGLDVDPATAAAATAHGFAGDEENTFLAQAQAVGAAEIPVMHVYGERRAGIPPDRSIEQFYAAYRQGGRGYFERIMKPVVSDGSRHDLTVSALAFLLANTQQLPGAPPEVPLPNAPAWQVADFAGRAEVRVLDDMLIIEKGNDMTGITCVEAPPRIDYEISLDAMRLSGGDFFCGLTAPYKDSNFSLVVGGWGGTCVGISSVGWLDAYHNETARFRSFDDHRWYRIRLRVTDNRIQAWIDGDEVVDLSVDGREIDIRWEMAPTTPLGIATWRTTGAIKNFSMRPLSPQQ